MILFANSRVERPVSFLDLPALIKVRICIPILRIKALIEWLHFGQVIQTVRLTEQSAARNYPSISVRSSYLLDNTNCLQGLEVTKLGISVEPAEVRLITSANDPYTWQILAEKKHLFKKSLSKHSIGAYRELRRGVSVF